MAFIEVIPFEKAYGQLKEIYESLIESRGKLAEVHKILSLNPDTIIAHMDLYMKIMFGNSPLKRYQREMIGVIVSLKNQCPYCVRHHGDALLHFWKDNAKLNNLLENYQDSELSETDLLLCKWAEMLTLKPYISQENGLIKEMKNEGLSDRAILDASLVISYFNFVNRLVMGLGVELEAEGGHGYKYD